MEDWMKKVDSQLEDVSGLKKEMLELSSMMREIYLKSKGEKELTPTHQTSRIEWETGC